jgi:hypothetical protein
MHTPHPSLAHINAALESLYSALGELRAGDDAYRFERTGCQDMINSLIDLMRDVQHTDRSLDELLQRELRDEELAWRRQTMPSVAGRL